jgi:hypothetical protein
MIGFAAKCQRSRSVGPELAPERRMPTRMTAEHQGSRFVHHEIVSLHQPVEDVELAATGRKWLSVQGTVETAQVAKHFRAEGHVITSAEVLGKEATADAGTGVLELLETPTKAAGILEDHLGVRAQFRRQHGARDCGRLRVLIPCLLETCQPTMVHGAVIAHERQELSVDLG